MIVSSDFLNHWKTEHLITLTGDDSAPLMLIRLWGHCQQRKRWEFDLNPTVLKSICKSKVSGEELISILKECGFIDVEGRTFKVHDWEDVNASLITSWNNGKKGGRPLSVKKPTGYPRDTHGVTQEEPEDNLLETDKIREDKMRLEKTNTGAGEPAGNVIVLELSGDDQKPKARKDKGSLEELKTFAVQELNLPESDAEWLFDKWEGNGWSNNKTRIKDWKATMRSWHRMGNIFPSQKQIQNGNNGYRQASFPKAQEAMES